MIQRKIKNLKKKTHQRSHLRSKRNNLFHPKGYIADILIIVLVVVISFFMIGNLFPKFSANPISNDVYEINPTTSVDIHNNLQLKTLQASKCSGTTAVDFLIDMSGSMEIGSKSAKLTDALTFFASNFPDTGVVAMQTFNETTTEAVPFGFFQDQKQRFTNAIRAFAPIGGTYSLDAFTFAKQKLDAAIADPRFARYKFAMIFISDGIPETRFGNSRCDGSINGPNCAPQSAGSTNCRCFDPDQDPTGIAKQIKDNGTRIFTIRYVDDSEAKFNTKLTELMTNVASSADDAFPAPLNNQLTDIMQKISTRICTQLSAN